MTGVRIASRNESNLADFGVRALKVSNRVLFCIVAGIFFLLPRNAAETQARSRASKNQNSYVLPPDPELRR
jgi:hypothetical protein